MADLPSRDGVQSGGLESGAHAPAAGRVSVGALWRLLRPRQWTKNLLVFAALLFAKEIFHAEALGLAAVAFVAFCMASSSVYIVNDVLDAERDRRHPIKRLRPIASGEVGTGQAGLLAALLTIGALAIAFWVRPPFGAAIAVYIALSHAYSLGGKNIVILDVMFIATGFVLRAVGGALAIDVPSSDWFILCTFFGALFIALSKRRGELAALETGAGRHREVLERYTPSSLSTYTGATMAAVVITYALYVREMQDIAPLLPLTMPFVLFGVFRYHYLVDATTLGDRPEEVLLQDRPTQLCVVGFGLGALAALYLGR